MTGPPGIAHGTGGRRSGRRRGPHPAAPRNRPEWIRRPAGRGAVCRPAGGVGDRAAGAARSPVPPPHRGAFRAVRARVPDTGQRGRGKAPIGTAGVWARRPAGRMTTPRAKGAVAATRGAGQARDGAGPPTRVRRVRAPGGRRARWRPDARECRALARGHVARRAKPPAGPLPARAGKSLTWQLRGRTFTGFHPRAGISGRRGGGVSFMARSRHPLPRGDIGKDQRSFRVGFSRDAARGHRNCTRRSAPPPFDPPRAGPLRARGWKA